MRDRHLKFHEERDNVLPSSRSCLREYVKIGCNLMFVKALVVAALAVGVGIGVAHVGAFDTVIARLEVRSVPPQ